MKTLGATVPEHAPAVAAKVIGHPEMSRSAIGRTAYRVARGMPLTEALKLELRETQGHGGMLNFGMQDDEINHGDDSLARIVRKGLGMLMGMTEAQAEMWAEASVPIGRPRKDASV